MWAHVATMAPGMGKSWVFKPAEVGLLDQLWDLETWRLRFFENRTGEQQKENDAKTKCYFYGL